MNEVVGRVVGALGVIVIAKIVYNMGRLDERLKNDRIQKVEIDVK